jgi:hypothetical protein
LTKQQNFQTNSFLARKIVMNELKKFFVKRENFAFFGVLNSEGHAARG